MDQPPVTGKANSREEESPVTPFDDFAQGEGQPVRTLHLGAFKKLLRALSAIALVLALSSAVIVVLLDSFNFFNVALLPWKVKSAYPLIFIGCSYGLLQFTLKRTHAEFLLGIAVSTAFIAWGAEQFLGNYPRAVGLIDDFVMFLFVMDLGIVVRGWLKKN